MTTPHYYVYPFGQNADDLTAIPDAPAIDGSVSYFYGWTDPYEYDLLTNPAALPIPRGQMNQLFFDITNNIQEYQQYGSPQWVVGNTVSYPIYARVYYAGQVYESQTAANTNTPGTDNTWAQISAGVQGIPTGSIVPFGGVSAPAGYLLCNGTTVSRTTYAALKSAITQVQSGVTLNTMTSLTGLTDTSNMYVGMAIEGAGIQNGTTIATIVSGTAVTMSLPATGSATVSVTFFNWGNGNGSTTFTLPNMARRVPMGAGGSASSVIPPGIYNAVGSIGGEEGHVQQTNEVGVHTHSTSVSPSAPFLVNGGGSNNMPGGGIISVVGALTINPTPSPVAANVIQPSAIVSYIIKT